MKIPMSRLLFGAAALTLALATTASAATAAKGRILVVLSGASNLPLNNGKVHPTGYYLNELGVPAERLTDAGYTLVIATPEGKLPTLDPGSDSAVFFMATKPTASPPRRS